MARRGAHARDVSGIDFRAHPERYRIGRGEEGVFGVEPYKRELLPLWRFATPDLAAESAGSLFAQYLQYRDEDDFVGMDMARKFLQMGYTRSRRYASWPGGRKRDATGAPRARRAIEDAEKAESAAIFKAVWDDIRADPRYATLRARHQQMRAGQGAARAGTS